MRRHRIQPILRLPTRDLDARKAYIRGDAELMQDIDDRLGGGARDPAGGADLA